MTDLIQLREPLWLLLALLPVLLMALSFLFHRWQRTNYADAHLRDWVISKHSAQQASRWWQLICTHLAWMAFAIAMAGPRIPIKYLDTQQQYTSQLYVLVDLSASMSAADIQPSRIERVKLELLDLIDRLQHTQMGLIVFAAQPHVLTPPTADKTALRHYVQTLRAGLLPTAGTQMLNAIDFARLQLKSANDVSNAILLITDGEHHLSAQQLTDALPQLIEQLKRQRIQLYTLGVGSTQGAAILTADKGWLNDENQAAVSRLNTDYLQQLAELGNGQFQRIRDDDSDWQTLYDQGIAQMSLTTLQQQQDELVQWRELFGGFILGGILLLVLSIWQPRLRHVQSLLMLPLLYFSLFSLSEDTFAAESEYAHAYRLYQQGDLQAAKKSFASVPGYTARFAQASCAYQLQEYKQAIPLFVQAILQAGTDQQRADAIFNLANSYFKLAQYAQAKQLYTDVLRYQPGNHAASVNLEYAVALEKQATSQQTSKALREGTGPRTADAPPNMDIERGRLSLGDATNNNTDASLTATDTSPQQATEILLQQSRPASEQIEYSEDPSWTYNITTLSELHLQHQRPDVDESELWQRLFEIEEGFMAAQEEPKTLPGVKPW